MTIRHEMHKTAVAFALKNKLRLGRDFLGYTLHGSTGAIVQRPAWGEHTAAGAVRMMRGALRHPDAMGARATSNAFAVRGLGREV